MNKIRAYLNTFELTRGFFIALLSTAFIYLEWWDLSSPFLHTLLGLMALYFLLPSTRHAWLWSGFFTGLFWFWWIGLSFNHYQMPWVIPFVLLCIGMVYALLFWLIAYLTDTITISLIQRGVVASSHLMMLLSLLLRSFGLLLLSYIHPFGFDWFKPELLFIGSYLGIMKWQFTLILLGISLAIWKKQLRYLSIILLSFQTPLSQSPTLPSDIEIITTYTPVKEKWDESLHPKQFNALFKSIDQAISVKKRVVILPESVFPVFINHSDNLIQRLQQRAQKITIVAGGLYWDGEVPRNSTYIFRGDKITVANKVILVPFGESNPLPDFLSDWVNRVFYDGAVDYKASTQVVDYTIDKEVYRNAICFEATSETLYQGSPKKMIVLSNNGWFTPSTEPTLQRLLLQYYSKKYGTTIYHAVNMSRSYTIQDGKVIFTPH